MNIKVVDESKPDVFEEKVNDLLKMGYKISSTSLRTLKIYWDYEDEVEVYKITDGMFKASKLIDGVRMYPYIIFDDGRKFYLEY